MTDGEPSGCDCGTVAPGVVPGLLARVGQRVEVGLPHVDRVLPRLRRHCACCCRLRHHPLWLPAGPRGRRPSESARLLAYAWIGRHANQCSYCNPVSRSADRWRRPIAQAVARRRHGWSCAFGVWLSVLALRGGRIRRVPSVMLRLRVEETLDRPAHRVSGRAAIALQLRRLPCSSGSVYLFGCIIAAAMPATVNGLVWSSDIAVVHWEFQGRALKPALEP